MPVFQQYSKVFLHYSFKNNVIYEGNSCIENHYVGVCVCVCMKGLKIMQMPVPLLIPCPNLTNSGENNIPVLTCITVYLNFYCFLKMVFSRFLENSKELLTRQRHEMTPKDCVKHK